VLALVFLRVHPHSCTYTPNRSNVIENITAQHGLQENAAICFAYYNYQNTRLGEVSQVIAALIKQLCRKKDCIPQDLLKVKHDALPPSLIGTREQLVSLIEGLSQVFVVFDALDECPEQARKDILSFITSIVTVPGTCCVKVFVTSREEMDIAKAFQDKQLPMFRIQAENVAADIGTFARSQVEMLVKGEHGKTLYVTSDDLRDKIVWTLAAKADGM
jgi:DNA-binding Xre family transcriptional regulator